MTEATEVRSRRTQAERRATTQAALLDATIDCLVEEGYAGTTTTRIVERAGVSRGAQVHHFPTKAELVAEAVGHLARKRADEFFAELGDPGKAGRRRFEDVLDRLWGIHTSPLFAASVELSVAARTDPDLRGRLQVIDREVVRTVVTGIVDLFPELAAERRFRETIDTALAAMRGLALLEFVEEGSGRRPWPGARRLLLDSFERLAAA